MPQEVLDKGLVAVLADDIPGLRNSLIQVCILLAKLTILVLVSFSTVKSWSPSTATKLLLELS